MTPDAKSKTMTTTYAKLQGSEKQIKWANDLREAQIKCIEKRIAEISKNAAGGDQYWSFVAKAIPHLQAAIEAWKSCKSSTWIIDRRSDSYVDKIQKWALAKAAK